MGNDYTINIYESINSVNKVDWDSLASENNIFYSYDFLGIIEDSKIVGVNDFCYLLIYQGKELLAIAVCSIIKINLFKHNHSSRFVDSIIKKLFSFKMLQCGSPINISTPPYIIKKGENSKILKKYLLEQLKKLAKQRNISLILIKNLHEKIITDKARVLSFTRSGYSLFESVPNTVINIKWNSIDQYVLQMKSYYRSKLKKHLKRTKNISCRIIYDYMDLADELETQWLTVYKNTNCPKLEVINADYFRNLKKRYKENTFILSFEKDNQILGFALLLKNNETLHWLYIGRKKSENDSLYMLIMYKVIETSINLGVVKIDCGPTTYSIKQDMGAEIIPLNCALSSHNFFIRRLIGIFYPKQEKFYSKNIFRAHDVCLKELS